MLPPLMTYWSGITSLETHDTSKIGQSGTGPAGECDMEDVLASISEICPAPRLLLTLEKGDAVDVALG